MDGRWQQIHYMSIEYQKKLIQNDDLEMSYLHYLPGCCGEWTGVSIPTLPKPDE